MVRLGRSSRTVIFILTLVCAGAGLIYGLFNSSFKSIEADIASLQTKFQESRELLEKKKAVDEEWRSKKDFLTASANPEALQSQWVKDLLASAQTQALPLEKIEPTGAGIFISFRGDIRQLVRFIYRLKESDPLSCIGSYNARKDEDSEAFTHELVLLKSPR